MREANDLYPTDVRLVRKAIELVNPQFKGVAFDVGCNNGVWGAELCASNTKPSEMHGIDISETANPDPDVFDNYWCADYLTFETEKHLGVQPDLIISNPPYSLAEQFVRKAYKDISRYGQIIMLLRLGFLASDKRVDLWDNINYKPTSIHVVQQRPSFANYGTDRYDYAIYNWEYHKPYDHTELHWMSWR